MTKQAKLQEELSTAQRVLSKVEGIYSVKKAESKLLEEQLVELELRARTAEEELQQAKQVKQVSQKVQSERDDLAAQVELKDKQLDWERKVGLQ